MSTLPVISGLPHVTTAAVAGISPLMERSAALLELLTVHSTWEGRSGNNYSPRGLVGGGGRGKREFVSPAPHHHPASQGNLQT